MIQPGSEERGIGDDQYVWYLASTERRPSGVPRTYNVGVPIANAEFESYRSAVELLEHALPKSPFAAFQERCMEFMRAASEALRRLRLVGQRRHSRR
jgi:hypothetical protein